MDGIVIALCCSLSLPGLARNLPGQGKAAAVFLKMSMYSYPSWDGICCNRETKHLHQKTANYEQYFTA